MGRIGKFLADTGATGDKLLERDKFAHSLMYLTRGQPVVYYGDEQGFTGDGGDQDARQDMFASQVASYNDDDLIGTTSTTAAANYDTRHPLYRHIAALVDAAQQHPTLADGAQVHRYADDAARHLRLQPDLARARTSSTSWPRTAPTQTKSATFPTYSPKQHVHQGCGRARGTAGRAESRRRRHRSP